MEKTKIEPRTKPLILIVADEDGQTPLYEGRTRFLGYDTISVFNEWNSNQDLLQDKRVVGHCGPLCEGFMQALIEKVGPTKYDCAVVDLLSEDLIRPMKKAGYNGPVVVIGTPFRENYPFPIVEFGQNFDRDLREKLATALEQK